MNELQKKALGLKELVEESCTLAERLVSNRITASEYISREKGNTSNMHRLQQEISTIAKAL